MSMAKKQNKSKTNLFSVTRKKVIYFWLVATFPILLIFLLLFYHSFSDLPSIIDLKDPQLTASVVYANDGETEMGRYWKVNRVVCRYDSISPYLTDALISTEDERFFSHSGIDVKAIGRAIVNVGGSGGASTITQQLAKQLFTLKERQEREERIAAGEEEETPFFGRYGRKFNRLVEKVKENIISTRIEETFTKEEIITMYLNQFDFLYNAVGIANACKIYFNKTPSTITKEEAAMLIGMCKNPTLFNPYTFSIKNYRAILAERNGVSIKSVKTIDIEDAKSKDSLRAVERRNQVLQQWLKNSNRNNKGLRVKISQADYEVLSKKPIKTDFQQLNFKKGRATYFKEALRKEVVDLLAQKDENGDYRIYKRNPEDPEDKSRPYNIYEDGLRIYTTIDYRMQVYAEEALNRHLKQNLQPAFNRNNRGLRNYPFSNSITNEEVNQIMTSAIHRSNRYYNLVRSGYTEPEILKNFRVKTSMKIFTWRGVKDTVMTPYDSILHYKSYLQAGLVSIEPGTGFVKAWVGGADIDYFAYDHVRLGKRQVGSTIKPFVYATAMSMGVIKACTQIPNVRHCIKLYDDEGNYTKSWCPKGGGGGGSVTVKRALAQSMNNIAAAIINKLGRNGPKTVASILEQMDIHLEKRDITPSMCLGSMDLSLIQLVGAQATFVNHGLYNRPTTILRIEDRYGNEIYTSGFETKEVFNETYAYSIIDMMKEVINSGTATSLRSGQSWGGIRYPTAGKTGTTQSNSDGWFVGLTPELVTGVWVGAEDRAVRFKTMAWGQGARLALPIYGYYMQFLYGDSKVKISKKDFEKPQGFDESKVDCNESYTFSVREIEEEEETKQEKKEEAVIPEELEL
jgi:penicillin-binding protein 1A